MSMFGVGCNHSVVHIWRKNGESRIRKFVGLVLDTGGEAPRRSQQQDAGARPVGWANEITRSGRG